MIDRILEPEVMDSADEARDYDAMDHAVVNRLFAADFRSFLAIPGHSANADQLILDVGTGTAQIPIELCWQHAHVKVLAIDMAEHMLNLGRDNVRKAGLVERITLQKADAKKLPFPSDHFDAVMSNSIVHHIPRPGEALAEIVRVATPGGSVFIRDLLRPNSESELRELVQRHAGDASAPARQMFADSLHAALTLEEIRSLVAGLSFEPGTVVQTSDRHWTWSVRRGMG